MNQILATTKASLDQAIQAHIKVKESGPNKVMLEIPQLEETRNIMEQTYASTETLLGPARGALFKGQAEKSFFFSLNSFGGGVLNYSMGHTVTLWINNSADSWRSRKFLVIPARCLSPHREI